MKRDQALDTVKKLTMEDRNQTHGDPVLQFEKAQRIKDAVGHRSNPNLTPAEIECIEMICTKLSRWTTGQTRTTEHALDIIGYASIAVEAISGNPHAPAVVQEFLEEGGMFADKVSPVASPFAGVGQVARRFAANPRKVEEVKTDGSAA